MPIIPLNRPQQRKQISAKTTDNKYVLLTPQDEPYINSTAVEDFFFTFNNLPLKNQGPHVQSGVTLFMRDRHKGLKKYTKKMDLMGKFKNSTEEDFENHFSDAISLYLYKEKGKFPPKENNDLQPGDFDDIGLDEIGMTTHDFNF